VRVGEVPAKSTDTYGSEETCGIPPSGSGLVHLTQARDDDSALEEVLGSYTHVQNSSLFHLAI